MKRTRTGRVARTPAASRSDRRRRSGWPAALVALLALVFQAGAVAAPGVPPEAGPRVRAIVGLQDGVDPHAAAREMERRYDGDIDLVYDTALNGFAGAFPQGRLANIERDPRVADVELDQIAYTAAQLVPTGVERIFAVENDAIRIDGNDDRVDVDVAVIDTGIDLDHPELNVVAATDCSGGSPFAGNCGQGGDDDHGHGTHVAGTIGAIDDDSGVVGVASGARLSAVKVLRSDGSGYLSWIIAGIEWVTERADQIEVANLSLGCECSSSALDTAITNSVAAGVAYAVASGNSGTDSATFSPANHPDVLTVSALADFDGAPGGLVADTSDSCFDDEDDTLANFSNWGEAVDIAAPGVCILSTLPGGYGVGSGTSMAAPHAAGALGLLASGSGNDPQDKADVEDLYAVLVGAGNTDWDDDSGDGVHEPLLDVGDDTSFTPVFVDGGDESNAAPTSTFTSTCVELTCDFDGSESSDADGSIASYDWDLGDGTTASGVSLSHTYDAPGDYTVTLTVVDDDGAADQDSQTVSVSDGSTDGSTEATGVHVHQLTGASSNQGSTWSAEVTVFVHDENGPVNGETVSFDYLSTRGSIQGTTDCATVGDGTCTVAVSGIPKRDGSITFSVTGMSSGSLEDSHETQTTVSKP